MKLTVISLIILIFCISSVNAELFDFSFNDVSNINKEISVFINHNFSTSHDIKIYIHNSSNSEIKRSEVISETLNNDAWKDSWNYINSAIPNNNQFKIRLESYSENTTICVKIRVSNSSSANELCKPTNFSLEPTNNEKKSSKAYNFYNSKSHYLRLSIIISSFILVLLILILLAIDIKNL